MCSWNIGIFKEQKSIHRFQNRRMKHKKQLRRRDVNTGNYFIKFKVLICSFCLPRCSSCAQSLLFYSILVSKTVFSIEIIFFCENVRIHIHFIVFHSLNYYCFSIFLKYHFSWPLRWLSENLSYKTTVWIFCSFNWINKTWCLFGNYQKWPLFFGHWFVSRLIV